MLSEKELNKEVSKHGRYPWVEEDAKILENVDNFSYRKGHHDGFNVGALAMAVSSLIGAGLLFVTDTLKAKFKK